MLIYIKLIQFITQVFQVAFISELIVSRNKICYKLPHV